jgi:SpoVK/Ycf46/Vps4 family AAA+-type ATPase
MHDIMSNITSGLRKIELIFERASEQARKEKRSVILFLDEIDLLIGSRDGENNLSLEQKDILQRFLTCLDNVKVNKKGVIIIACTNKYDEVDEAIKRYGRIGLHMEFPFPNQEEIRDIASELAAKKKIKIAHNTMQFLCEHLEGKNTGEIIHFLLCTIQHFKKKKKKIIEVSDIQSENIFSYSFLTKIK